MHAMPSVFSKICCNSQFENKCIQFRITYFKDEGMAVNQKGEVFLMFKGQPYLKFVVFLFQPKKLGFSHFGNLRKKKFDESTDYICPMDATPAATNGTQKNYGGYKGLSPLTDKELDQVGQTD